MIVDGFRSASPILVTGVTGFIGREVVRRLLALGRPVVALVRPQNGHSAAERVVRTICPTAGGGQLEVVEGDLALPDCGIREWDWQRLRESVETVIHCAGQPLFFPEAMAPFRAGHIDGPLALLRRLKGGRLRRWAHLSTAYVCGRRSGTVLESEGDVGQAFHNPYEQVKLESEVAVGKAGAQLGIDVRIFRPSIVAGSAPETPGGAPSHLFFRFIRLVAALALLSKGHKTSLRIEASPHARLNIVPIEYVAGAIVALADHPDGVGKTFHLVVSDAPTQQAVLGIIAARLGMRGISLVDPTLGPLDRPSPLERSVARMLSSYHDYLQGDLRFDDTNSRRLLICCGIRPPGRSSQVVHRLIDQALAASGRLAAASLLS